MALAALENKRKKNVWNDFKYFVSQTWPALTVIFVSIMSLAAFLTHVIKCILLEKFVLLLVGVIAPPVGVLHGVGLWLGLF